ncbi:MAG: NADH-quinone oxidoreductase subunit N, partial [Verrucomicrobiaceae bacterium]|nr:NADH-quinone oxidoreductase subunit N [Verrucomicrobiaceae bacterium]
MTNYFELLQLAAPEAVILVTALVVLALGLAKERTSGICSAVAAAGLLFGAAAVLMSPPQANLFHGMLVITPLTSLFKIICLALAFFTVILARGNGSSRHHGEYLALLLLATIGLMLLVGSEELLMIFIGLELTGLSLYVMAAFDKSDVRSAEAGLKYFLFGS